MYIQGGPNAHGVYGNNFVYSQSFSIIFWHIYTVGNLQLDGV